ncbi:MAG: hypothetical protein MZV64_18545 [Ignavibacteriales bacterium]|nr:hypothetical protein [Ignavibacteriales bacterium]
MFPHTLKRHGFCAVDLIRHLAAGRVLYQFHDLIILDVIPYPPLQSSFAGLFPGVPPGSIVFCALATTGGSIIFDPSATTPSPFESASRYAITIFLGPVNLFSRWREALAYDCNLTRMYATHPLEAHCFR